MTKMTKINTITGDLIAEGAELFKELLEKCVKNKVNLHNANLKGADLYNANLKGADLYNADLKGADLYNADLKGADLKGANLLWANLQGANLQGVNLQGANLQGANLEKANIKGANLIDVDFEDANLEGVDLDLEIEEGLIKKIAVAALKQEALNMEVWHTCDTTHCIAGWACHLAKNGEELERRFGCQIAGLKLLGIEAHSHFFDDNEAAKKWLGSKLEDK